MNILALRQGVPVGGSVTSLQRICAHLRSCGHTVTAVLPEEVRAKGALDRVVAAGSFDAVFGLHAYWAGRLCVGSSAPYVLVLSGTDVNEFVRDPYRLEVMTAAVEGATELVAYSGAFADRAIDVWPQLRDRVTCIGKSVSTSASDFSLRRALGVPPDGRLYLLPSVIHPIKDLLFLAATVAEWHREDPRIHLAVVGLRSDEGYAAELDAMFSMSDGLHRLEPIAQEDLHAAMIESSAVLNTSRSESSPNAILEAMDLGRPVVVRNIQGNMTLVEHGVTGSSRARQTRCAGTCRTCSPIPRSQPRWGAGRSARCASATPRG